MCLPFNNIPRGGGRGGEGVGGNNSNNNDDPAELGRGGGGIPTPEEMTHLVSSLRSGSEDELLSALRTMKMLAICRTHAPIILETPGAVSAIVSVMYGTHHEHLSPLSANVRGEAAEALCCLTCGDIHGPPPRHEDPTVESGGIVPQIQAPHTSRIDDYLRAVVEGGGIEATISFIQFLDPNDDEEKLFALCFTLLDCLTLYKQLSSDKCNVMMIGVVQAIKRFGEGERFSCYGYDI